MAERSPFSDVDHSTTATLRAGVDVARRRLDRGWIVIILLGLVAAVVSVVVATRLFPYHSLNHDEGVYLQQAELLLSGRLFLQPPVEGPFRPWFFVEGERGLYSKYAPVPAAVFALGRAVGAYPLALAAISGTVVAGTATLARELFDWRVGVLAGLLVLASPLFVLHSGVYLPYALTAAFEVVFAVTYLRGERTGSRRLAAVAGVAVGLAFFARPFTALLFGAPFVVHACVTLVSSGAWRSPFTDVDDDQRALFGRRLATAGLGTAGVLAALGYNAVVTGDPLVFPYQAFAPEDGIGFGHRELLGHEADYTLDLALEANALVLTDLFTEWVALGLAGTALAALGVLAVGGSAIRSRVRRVGYPASDSPSDSPGDTTNDPPVDPTNDRATTQLVGRRMVLAGLYLTIPAGNVAFWGNYNILGALDVPDDGLIHHLGPYYHYDLLVPTAIFGAVAAVWAADWLCAGLEDQLPETLPAGGITVALLVVAAGVGGAVAADTAAGPIERNTAVSDELETAYEPFESAGGLAAGNAALAGNATDERTLTFLPPVYGVWLNHPFQAVRNDPEFDGRSLYAIGDYDELDVAAANPDHDLRRYVVRGAWNPTDGDAVTAELRDVERVSGEQVRLDATVGVPDDAESVSIRAGGDAGQTYAAANASDGTLELNLTVTDEEARLSGPALSDAEPFAVAERDELRVTVFVETGPSAGFSYDLVFPVDTGGDDVRALSATRERCPVPDRCVPAGLGPSPPGTFANATVVGESG